MLQDFIKNQEGGVKGTVWTIGLVIVIVAVCLYLLIFAPDLTYAVFMRVVDFVLGNFGI